MFHSVFTTDNECDLHLEQLATSSAMNFSEITVNDILLAIFKMSNKLSRTPNGIPAYFLKRIAPSIIDVLCYLFNLSLSSSTMPYQWKQALVISMHKKGSRDLPTNYRPISLTCNMCHLLESIVAEKLRNYLLCNGILTPSQYGFLPSTYTQLISALNKWHYAYDNNIDLMLFTQILQKLLTLSHTLNY